MLLYSPPAPAEFSFAKGQSPARAWRSVPTWKTNFDVFRVFGPPHSAWQIGAPRRCCIWTQHIKEDYELGGRRRLLREVSSSWRLLATALNRYERWLQQEPYSVHRGAAWIFLAKASASFEALFCRENSICLACASSRFGATSQALATQLIAKPGRLAQIQTTRRILWHG